MTPSSASPIGATVSEDGVNFCLYSRHATGVDLLFFDRDDAAQPIRTIPFDPYRDRSYHYWHTFVPGVKAGQLYGYRVHGPKDPLRGLRFDPDKVLIDPYGRGVVVPEGYHPDLAKLPGSNTAFAMKSVVVDPSDYDWEGDTRLHTPDVRTIIYEMHVRGFTCNPNSGVAQEHRGTYAGLIEKIPYLKQLGITAVELLPVHAFDRYSAPAGRMNYWGYQTVSYFAPHPQYSSRQDPLGPIREFRDMVKALHRAGIEVILDVVFNHTAEGDHNGPTLSFRGIDNPTYYMLEQGGELYSNYSGCGNTVNANHPVVRRMIVDSLKYWVEEMHVDGFRFDLASILARDQDGQVLPNPPVLWDIESEPALAGVKLIAEAWDAAGLYQVGRFVGDAWKEWNGKFRDDVRDFFRAEPGSLQRFADCIVGSNAIYGHKNREAEQSVNFVTCHDGFTLNDLVSYDTKHNEGNGEDNRDGANDNRSWNCGTEGPTTDPAILNLRQRQSKNFLVVTALSIGIPMIPMGDEVCRTQHGNNNAYCRDDESNWFDWGFTIHHADMLRFVQMLFQQRGQRSIAHENRGLSLSELISRAEKFWHGVHPNQPDWNVDSHCIAFETGLRNHGKEVYILFNAYWESRLFTLPSPSSGPWMRWIDTALDSPNDIVPWNESPQITTAVYPAQARSVVVLYSNLK